jgi:hypothetical protein
MSQSPPIQPLVQPLLEMNDGASSRNLQKKSMETYAADEHFKEHDTERPVVRRVCIR